jgi:pimeloyl-ACP methyl ester carboxylesterase
MTSAPPRSLDTLVGRYDPEVVDLGERRARIRLKIEDGESWDVLLDSSTARLESPRGKPDATLSADAGTWNAIAEDVRGGMQAFQAGRLSVRHNLHLGVGFLAATSGLTEEGRLRLRTVATAQGRIATLEAGTGPAVIGLHGLGASKVSLLPTVAALNDRFRVIAIDLPGFGDSDKPLGAGYDPPFFARAVLGLLDCLDIDRAHLVGNSLGGRVALEVGLRHPDRVDRLALLAPSLAWRRSRPWAAPLRLVRPELGVIQPAPRKLVESIVARVVPGARDGWTAAGVDEFLRAYLTPRGRAAFYAAARQIYLEEPNGDGGFWTRLGGLKPDALFVWGARDRVVPKEFARHVRRTLPSAEHLELDCGHVPQVERPRETHAAIEAFLTGAPRATAGAATRA